MSRIKSLLGILLETLGSFVLFYSFPLSNSLVTHTIVILLLWLQPLGLTYHEDEVLEIILFVASNSQFHSWWTKEHLGYSLGIDWTSLGLLDR